MEGGRPGRDTWMLGLANVRINDELGGFTEGYVCQDEKFTMAM